MSEQCGGQWHEYPDCTDCPLLYDSCDGTDEYAEIEEKRNEDNSKS